MPVLAFATTADEVTQGSPSGAASSTSYISSDVRAGIKVQGRNYLPSWGAYQLALPSINHFWFTFTFQANDHDMAPATLLRISGDDGTLFQISLTSDSGDIMTFYVSDGTNLNSIGTLSDVDKASVQSRWDVEISPTACRIYVDNALMIEHLADLSLAPAANQMIIGGITYQSGDYVVMSAIIFADEDTRGMRMHHHTLTADGGFSDFGGSYTDVDNPETLGGTGVEMNTDGGKSTFLVDEVNADMPDNVIAVGVYSRAKSPELALIKNQQLIAINGGNTAESGSIALTPSEAPASHIFYNSPDGTPWTKANILETEFGIKAFS